jgi:Putative transmembrane protein (PGPGW)
VLVAGVALIVLPGPAVLVIPLGFAILATEFHWARRLLDRAKAPVLRLKQVISSRAWGKRIATPG